MFNTATVRSKISYIDGDKGILRYRGYPIEQLAEKSTFLEVPPPEAGCMSQKNEAHLNMSPKNIIPKNPKKKHF